MANRTEAVLFEYPEFFHDEARYLTFAEVRKLLRHLPSDWPVWIEEDAFEPGESDDSPWVYQPDGGLTGIVRTTHWTVGTFLRDARGKRGEVSIVVDVGTPWEAKVSCVTLYRSRVYLCVDLLRQIDEG